VLFRVSKHMKNTCFLIALKKLAKNSIKKTCFSRAIKKLYLYVNKEYRGRIIILSVDKLKKEKEKKKDLLEIKN
jgi:hypothetical protein